VNARDKSVEGWQERRIEGHLPLTWYEIGKGPEVLFLHGNLDHALYMPMLAGLGDHNRILLLRQRGAGCWRHPEAYNALRLEPFLDDIERLRVQRGLDAWAVVGHSWGATLALEYACAHPQRVSQLVLIGMGPINDEMSRHYRANVRKMVHPDRLTQFERVRQAWGEAFASGEGVPPELDAQYAELYSTVWAYASEKAAEIACQYLDAGGYRRVAAGAPRGDPQALMERMGRVRCPTLVVYGYQDYEPITQAYLLRERIPHAEIAYVDECGHYPWLDRPAEFRRIWTEFLTDT